MELFLADHDTRGVIAIGEIGGSEEQELAEFLAGVKPSIPVVGLVVGRYAPTERRMGHAGAFAQNAASDAENKINALRDAGVIIATSPHLVGETIREVMAGRP
jgi:succinyl-CoA synthetase alpha subunit